VRERDEPLSAPGRRAALAVGLDLLVVAAFTLVGRRSHDEPLDPAGWWDTAWPFLAGLAIGWVVVLLTSQAWPTRLWHGFPVWVSTVFGGMALRDMAGQGTALPFVVVATAFLGVFLLGWRAVLWMLDRRRPDPGPGHTRGPGWRGRVPVEHTRVGDPLDLERLSGPRDETQGRGVVPQAERDRVVDELGIRQPRSPEGD
jgi:hypothetical protein